MIVKEDTFVDRYSLKYYTFACFLILQNVGLYYTRNPAFVLLAVGLLTDLIGKLIKADTENFSKELSLKYNNKTFFHLLPLYLHIVIEWVTLYWILRDFYYLFPTIFHKIVAIDFLGRRLGGCISVSHQLLHRDQYHNKVLAYIYLIPVLFPWYQIEHIKVHHKAVGTVADAITAQKNVSVYSYALNVYLQSVKVNYRENKFVFMLSTIVIIAWLFLLYKFFGFGRMLFGGVSALYGVFTIETIQYIEHYGLLVRQGSGEKVLPNNAWNTTDGLINLNLFRVQRHSDHHMNAYKIYPTMDLTEEMPEWPLHILLMSVLSHFPQTFYDLANPLVDKVLANKSITEEDKKIMVQKAQKPLRIFLLKDIIVSALLFFVV